jgi:arylformamidase
LCREKTDSGMSQIIELDHASPSGRGHPEARGEGINSFTSLRAMVLQSVGPVRHEVSVPFHDSQVRNAAILIQTGWDQHWGTEAYWEPGPVLAEHLIFRMVRAGVRILGVDFPVADRTEATRLITSGKLAIVENLHGLAALPRIGFRFTAIPLEPPSGDPVAVRAFAEIT